MHMSLHRLSVQNPNVSAIPVATLQILTIVTALSVLELSMLFIPYNHKWPGLYAKNMLDYHVILDLLATVALLYFENRFVVNYKQHPRVEDIKLRDANNAGRQQSRVFSRQAVH